MDMNPRLFADLAPTGVLRAAINLGNPILARQDRATAQVAGVAVDLATAFAARLGTGLELVVFDTAAKAADALACNQLDIGFMAIDPVRGQDIHFTPPYILIEGSYLVAAASPIQINADVDQPGHRVVVGAGSAYDLYLSRTLQHARILRAPASPAVVDAFVAGKLEVAAGVRQQLQADAMRHAGLRLLDGHFMLIRQAMGLPKARSAEALDYLSRFVEHMKANGFIAEALARHHITGAEVAPAGS